jgi:hypothetical protein
MLLSNSASLEKQIKQLISITEFSKACVQTRGIEFIYWLTLIVFLVSANDERVAYAYTAIHTAFQHMNLHEPDC